MNPTELNQLDELTTKISEDETLPTWLRLSSLAFFTAAALLPLAGTVALVFYLVYLFFGGK